MELSCMMSAPSKKSPIILSRATNDPMDRVRVFWIIVMLCILATVIWISPPSISNVFFVVFFNMAEPVEPLPGIVQAPLPPEKEPEIFELDSPSPMRQDDGMCAGLEASGRDGGGASRDLQRRRS